MAPQSLTMISDKDMDAVLAQTVLLQPGDTPSNLFVHEGDLAVVLADEAPPAVFRKIGLRRLIGGIRVVKMDSGEEGAGLLLIQPGQRSIHHLHARFLFGPEVNMPVFLQVKLIVILLEALLKPPAPVQNKRTDEGTASIAAGREHLGDRGLLLAQGRIPVDPDAMVRGVHIGHNRTVGRKGKRRGSDRLLKENPSAGESIQVRRLHIGITVAGDGVGVRRVHRDQDDVGLVDADLGLELGNPADRVFFRP